MAEDFEVVGKMKVNDDEASRTLASFGEKAKNIGAGIGKAFAVGATAVAAVGTAAIAAGTAVYAMATKAGEAADDVLVLSEKIGVGTDALQKLQYTATMLDVPTETVTKSFTKLTMSINSAADPASKQAGLFDKLGVSVKNTDGSLRDSQEVWFDTLQALKNIPNETERNALAMQLMGKSATDLNPMINASKEELKALSDEAVASGNVLSQSQLESLAAVEDAQKRMKLAFTGIQNQVALIFAPGIATALESVTGYITQFTQILMDRGTTASEKVAKATDVVKAISTDISSKLPQVVETGLGIIKALVNGLIKSFPVLLPAVVQMILSIVDMIVEMLPMLLDAAVQIVMALANGLVSSLPSLIPAIMQAVLTIVQTLIMNLPQLITAALQIILALVQGIVAALPVLIAALPQLIKALVDGIVTNLPMIVGAAVNIIMALVNGLVGAIPALVEALPQIIMAIVMGLLSYLPQLIQVSVKMIITLADGLIKATPTLIKAVPQLIASLASALVKSMPQILQMGKDIVTGLWEGIESMWGWLVDKVTGLFKDLVAKAKELLKIGSPSKVFEDEVGGPIPTGVGRGIEKNWNAPMKALSSGVDSLKGQMAGTFSVGSAGGSTSNVLTFNINGAQDPQAVADEITKILKMQGVQVL